MFFWRVAVMSRPRSRHGGSVARGEKVDYMNNFNYLSRNLDLVQVDRLLLLQARPDLVRRYATAFLAGFERMIEKMRRRRLQ
jgi:hypothetical protein